MLAKELLLVVKQDAVVDWAHFSWVNINQRYENIPVAKPDVVDGLFVNSVSEPRK